MHKAGVPGRMRCACLWRFAHVRIEAASRTKDLCEGLSADRQREKEIDEQEAVLRVVSSGGNFRRHRHDLRSVGSSYEQSQRGCKCGADRCCPDRPQQPARRLCDRQLQVPRGLCPPVRLGEAADGRPDRALKLEGSSAISSGYLERHPGPDEFTCDGTWHTNTWQIDSTTEYGHGTLIPGQVYVQFCWDGPTWHAYSEQFARAS